jgi:hypothetical protein
MPLEAVDQATSPITIGAPNWSTPEAVARDVSPGKMLDGRRETLIVAISRGAIGSASLEHAPSIASKAAPIRMGIRLIDGAAGSKR